MTYTAKVERPVSVQLFVRTLGDPVEEWPATEEDIEKFNLLDRLAYTKSRLDLEKFLGVDFTDYKEDGSTPVMEAVNLALYLVEALTIYDHATLDHPEYQDDARRLSLLLSFKQLPPSAEDPQ